MQTTETKRTTKAQGIGVGATILVVWDKLKDGIDYLAGIDWSINLIDWSLAMPWIQEMLALVGVVFGAVWGFDQARNKIGVQKPRNKSAQQIVGEGPPLIEQPAGHAWSPAPPAPEKPVDKVIEDLPNFIPRNDFTLSQRSLENLKKVHPDLKKLVRVALQFSQYDFTVIEGIRTVERQRQLIKEGKSTTMNSRHLHGLAVDVMVYDENGKGTWEMPYYKAVADAFAEASRITGVTVEWGGLWAGFPDGPHFQLPFANYPNPDGFTIPSQS